MPPPPPSPPTHTASTRPATPAERAVIERQAEPDAASYGCLAVLFGVAPVVMLAAAGGWIARRSGPGGVLLGASLGALAGAAIFLYVLLTFRTYERRHRRRAAGDLRERLVQELAVRHPRAVEIGLVNDNAPVLAFDIGHGKLLFLQGQWLLDPSRYGAPPLEGDPHEPSLNGLPPPHCFPADAFTLTRLPHSGRVLRINVEGTYLPPDRTVEALRPDYDFADSELFDGDLDHIAQVLAREHAARASPPLAGTPGRGPG